MSNTYGQIYRLTTFGESHGTAIGGVIDGMPAGVAIDADAIQQQLDRRRPGQSALTTPRNEDDRVQILSGIFEGVTTGTPIGFVINNRDHHSTDYSNIKDAYRPSHADYTYSAKYGLRDYRGGGRSSARETAARVVGGAVAMQALATMGITVRAYVSQVGAICLDKPYTSLDMSAIDSNPVRCPDADTAERMAQEIVDVAQRHDSVGGAITCVVTGAPAGLGEPVFGKLQAMLAAGMMSINAAKGFEYGMGMAAAGAYGADVLDTPYIDKDGNVATRTNHSGGIQGGISNSQDIYMRVAFKPIATLMRPVDTIDNKGNNIQLEVKGRHDVCVVPRAVPIVEAMAAMTILDAILLDRCSRI